MFKIKLHDGVLFSLLSFCHMCLLSSIELLNVLSVEKYARILYQFEQLKAWTKAKISNSENTIHINLYF